MSDEQHRTPQEIQNEYSQLCMRIGDIQVKTTANDIEVGKMFKRIQDINVEILASNAYFAKLNAELEAKKNENP